MILSHRLNIVVTPKRLRREGFVLNDAVYGALGDLSETHKGQAGLISCVPSLPLRVEGDLELVTGLIVELVYNALHSNSPDNRTIVIQLADLGHSFLLMMSNTTIKHEEPIAVSIETEFQGASDKEFRVFSCHRLAEELGWTLTISSLPGAGSIVTLSGPVLEDLAV